MVVSFLRKVWVALAATALFACGGGSSGPPPADFSGISRIQEAVQPARVGPYQAALADCTLNAQRTQSCNLEELPFLGQTVGAAISVSDVMQRVIASSPWMAARFEAALAAMPASLLQMFKPVTAVVITGKVRPSFYLRQTGAIYIDPAHLWVTLDELKDVDRSPDYREGYDEGLKFIELWRYMSGNSPAYAFSDLNSTTDRQPSDIVLPLARVLIHELTHAADFAAPALIPGLDRGRPLNAVLTDLYDQRVSTRLTASQPLQSSLWKGLADVIYAGTAPTDAQKALTAADVSPDFAQDRASDNYGYSTQYEDTAMLAEEALMALWFGVRRDIALLDKPTASNPTAADYVVTWGQRGRVGASNVKAAATFVLNNILPGSDWASRMASLPAPTAMVPGLSWRDNRVLGPNANDRASLRSVDGPEHDPIRAYRQFAD